MFEVFLSWVNLLPNWLMTLGQLLILAIVASISISFLIGIYIGLMIIRKRAKQILEISFIPPKITFDDPSERINKE